MDLVHVTLSTRERAPLYTDEARLLALVRVVVRVLGARLVLFCVVDDHLHLVLAGEQVGYAVSGLQRALCLVCPSALAPAHSRPVRDRRHLETLVKYLLLQSEHHGLACPPSTWLGSCFQDLAGARLVHGYDARCLFGWLPRWSPARVAQIVGCPHLAPLHHVAGVPLTGLAQAAARVFATPLQGHAPAAVAARRAAAKLAIDAGFPTTTIAAALGCHTRSVRRLAGHAAADHERAVRLRLALERAG